MFSFVFRFIDFFQIKLLVCDADGLETRAKLFTKATPTEAVGRAEDLDLASIRKDSARFPDPLASSGYSGTDTESNSTGGNFLSRLSRSFSPLSPGGLGQVNEEAHEAGGGEAGAEEEEEEKEEEEEEERGSTRKGEARRGRQCGTRSRFGATFTARPSRRAGGGRQGRFKWRAWTGAGAL